MDIQNSLVQTALASWRITRIPVCTNIIRKYCRPFNAIGKMNTLQLSRDSKKGYPEVKINAGSVGKAGTKREAAELVP